MTTKRYKLLPSPFMDITDLHGYIGPLWWINSQPIAVRLSGSRYLKLWGTFGIGRDNLRVALELCND